MPRLSSARQADARTNGATHQTSSGRSNRMIAVSVRTESGTPCSSFSGTGLSRAGRRSRVHTVDELARQAGRRRQRVARVLDAPGFDADTLHRTPMPALALDDTAREAR